MIYLLNWRMWAGVAFLALLPILYAKGRTDGRKLEHAATTALVAQADHEARTLEQRRQDRVVEAVGLAAARETRIRADAAGARGELGRLRDTLDATKRASAQSADAARASAAALADVFGQCSASLVEMAEQADGHASDSMTLQQAWPK